MVNLFKFPLRSTGLVYTAQRPKEGGDVSLASDGSPDGLTMLVAAHLEVERALARTATEYWLSTDHRWLGVAALLHATDVAIVPRLETYAEGRVY